MGTFFEEILSEAKEGKRVGGGSTEIVDIMDKNNVRYFLKTQGIPKRYKYGASHLLGKFVEFPTCRMSREKLFLGGENKNNLKKNILDYYSNNICKNIDKQAFLIRCLRKKEFIYWEKDCDNINELEELQIKKIGNKNKNVSSNLRSQSNIKLISEPRKFVWNSISQVLRIWYKIPEDADIITINSDSSKITWREFIEKMRY